MPVGFSSAARNLFLLGSSGADAVTNFFKAIDKSSNPNEGYYTPSQIKYNYSDGKFLLSGTGLGNDSFGWVEKRDYDGSNSTSTEEWGVRISPAVYSSALTLTTMELDGNDNVIVVGKYGGVNGDYGLEAPYIAKYSNAGVLDWQSTSSTGDLEYTGVTSDSSGNYYACGNTPDTQISALGSDVAIAYVEKFDSNGNPGWGKAASMPNRDAVLTKIASNNKGAVIAVGYLEDDSAKKGYIVKIDSSTGEVLWDRTIKSQYDPDGLNSYQDVECKDIFIDSSGQIYIVGNKFNHGFIIKYTAEGNIIWQKQTDEGLFNNFTFEQVFSDGETEQAVVFGTVSGGLGVKRGLLSKYSKNGDLVWRRFLESSRDSGLQFDNVSLDADPSFYYLLFCDQVTSGMNPTKYTFGKVSSSGNGLGDFQYSSDGSTTIDYKVLNAPDQIGRLSDGSVSNSSSDLMSYPFTANKLLFDDLATNISNKKRQMDSADNFEYSGSPAIRVADFQELNLLGDTGFSEGPDLMPNGTFDSNIDGWVGYNSTPTWDAGRLKIDAPTVNDGAETSSGVPVSPNTNYRLSFDITYGTASAFLVQVRNSSNVSFPEENITLAGTTSGTHTISFNSYSNTSVYVRVMSGASTGTAFFDNIKLQEVKVLDQSGKGNDGVLNGPTYNAAGYWEFATTGGQTDGFTGSYIEIDYDTDLISTGFSLEFWFNGITTGSQAAQFIATQGFMGGGADNDSAWRIERNNIQAGTIEFNVNNGVGFNQNELISTNFPDGSWHHCVCTYNNGTMTIYKNGVQDIRSTSYTGTATHPDVDHVLRIGGRYDNAPFSYNGSIGEFRIYQRVLTPSQVYQNYNATKEKYTDVRPNTSPMIGPSIAATSNLILNYDFENNFCIEKSSNVSSYEFILDDATTNGASFGDAQSVATGYGKVVVGARGENCTNGGYTYTAGGKAYIYNATTGALETTLVASDISGNDWNFGNSVAICNCSGKIAVTSNNALYLYDADGTNEIIINESSTLPIIPPGGNTFGNGLAISGNRVWVSDHNVPTGPDYSGTVYCFNVETGALLYELRPKNTFNNFRMYGTRIAAGGGKLAIGAESISHPVTGRSAAGRVYLYDVDGRNEKILEPDTLTTSSLFGVDGIAIDHGMIVVGASRQQRIEDPLENGSGEVYVFDMKGDLDFSIRPSDDPANEDIDGFGFGSSVAVSSDRIIVGARYYAGNAGGVAGRAYQFTHKGKELQSWFGSGGADASSFGSSMDAVGGTLVIGAGSGSPDNSGRAYVYPLTGTPSGKVLNLSSSSFPGTINGGATFNPAGYFEFDGTNDYIQSSSVMAPGSADFSVILWYKITGTGGRGGLFERASSSPYSGWLLGQGGTNNWGASVRDANNDNATFAFTYPTVDQWTCDAFTWDYSGQTLTPYRNGANAGTATNTGNVGSLDGNSRYPMAIAARLDSASPQYLPMECGQVQMYSKVLTPAEVLQNFNATKSKYGL